MRYIQAFFMALGMFSSIPFPYRPWNEKARHLMLVFLPLVGLVIGFLWYGLYRLLGWSDIPLQLQAAVLLLYPFVVTGFIHLDGFMDTADAILSRRPLEDKLRILKDPHAGAFAVISVVILFILCFASMLSIMEQLNFKQALDIAEDDPMLSLILIPVITRCCSALAVLAGKPIAHSQYSVAQEGKKSVAEIAAVVMIGIVVMLVALSLGAGFLIEKSTFSVVIVLTGAVIAYLAAISNSVKQLRGVSGDLAGYALTIAEAFALVILALLA